MFGRGRLVPFLRKIFQAEESLFLFLVKLKADCLMFLFHLVDISERCSFHYWVFLVSKCLRGCCLFLNMLCVLCRIKGDDVKMLSMRFQAQA